METNTKQAWKNSLEDCSYIIFTCEGVTCMGKFELPELKSGMND